MEKIKQMITGHSKSDSSSNEPVETTGTFTPEEGHGLMGKSYHPEGEQQHGHHSHKDHHEGYSSGHHAGSAAEKAAYREEPLAAESAHEREAGHHGLGHRHHDGSAAEKAAYREEPLAASSAHGREEGLAGAGAGAAAVAGGAFAAEHERGREHESTGLASNNPYNTSTQAGAPPSYGGTGASGQGVTSDLAGAGYSGHGQSQTGGGFRDENETPAHGLNAGAEDPVAIGGRAPVSEPIHQDPSLMSGGGGAGYGQLTLGRQSAELGQEGLGHDSSLPGSGVGHDHSTSGGAAGGLVGKAEGLIHGHHTTRTGEALDPHISDAGISGLDSTGGNTYDNTSTSTHTKPGLMDKLNPKKDTDGDGKTGIME